VCVCMRRDRVQIVFSRARELNGPIHVFGPLRSFPRAIVIIIIITVTITVIVIAIILIIVIIIIIIIIAIAISSQDRGDFRSRRMRVCFFPSPPHCSSLPLSSLPFSFLFLLHPPLLPLPFILYYNNLPSLARVVLVCIRDPRHRSEKGNARRSIHSRVDCGKHVVVPIATGRKRIDRRHSIVADREAIEGRRINAMLWGSATSTAADPSLGINIISCSIKRNSVQN